MTRDREMPEGEILERRRLLIGYPGELVASETIDDVIAALEAVRDDPFPAFGPYYVPHVKRLELFLEKLKGI